jgi:hypothetical protein
MTANFKSIDQNSMSIFASSPTASGGIGGA